MTEYLCETEDFVKRLEDCEIVIMEKANPNDKVGETSIGIYTLAWQQVQWYLGKKYDEVCPGEFGCEVKLPKDTILISPTLEEGTKIETEYGVFNEKLYAALEKEEDNLYFQFVEHLHMLAECIRIKTDGGYTPEECGIDDPLNIALFP